LPVDEEGAVGRWGDGVIGVLGGEELEVLAVEADAVVGGVVGVAAVLFAYGEEVEGAGFLVDGEDLGDVAGAGGDLVLELAGGEVVEIHLAPVVAFGEPEEFVRGGQVVPVDLAVTALEELWRGLGVDVADVAGGGVGDAQPLLFMVA
jgi:hypothetical protein